MAVYISSEGSEDSLIHVSASRSQFVSIKKNTTVYLLSCSVFSLDTPRKNTIRQII